MKKNNILLSFIIVTLGFISCESDNEPVYDVNTMTAKSSRFTAPDPGNDYVLMKEAMNNTFEVYQWTQTDYGVPIGRKYKLEMDLYDKSFKYPQVLTTTELNEARFRVGELNLAINRLTMVDETNPSPVRLKTRIVTMGYGGEKGDVLLNRFPTVYSDPIEMIVQPYYVQVIPEKIYMTGDEFGNNNWEDPKVVQLTPVTEKPGFFYYISYFTAGKKFMFSADAPGSKTFNKLTTNSGFTAGTEYSEVATSGLYIVFIDFAGKNLTMAPAQIYGIGDCFGSWTEGENPFTIDNATGKASIKIKNTKDLRMYAKAPIGTIDWWRMEFNVLGGKIVYRGNGGDQEKVSAIANQTVTLDFKTGTGTIN